MIHRERKNIKTQCVKVPQAKDGKSLTVTCLDLWNHTNKNKAVIPHAHTHMLTLVTLGGIP